MGFLAWLRSIFSTPPPRAFDVRPLPPPDVGHDLAELARRLDLSVDELQQLRPNYRRIYIKKRTGHEQRVIDAPDPPTKAMQRRILRKLLSKLSVHPAAVGFRPGHSIVDNAMPHAGHAVVLKLDIRGFFGSTSEQRVHGYFRQIGWNEDAAVWLVRMCCHNGRLPQGAPTSPMLSNLVNYRLDSRLAALAASGPPRTINPKTLAELRRPGATMQITYTRYADDLTFSFSHDDTRVREMVRAVRSILEDEGYRLNGRKVRVLRRHQQQIVTGLVVNSGVNLPRKQRRKLRAVRHHRDAGVPATMTEAELQGWTAFERMVAAHRGG